MLKTRMVIGDFTTEHGTRHAGYCTPPEDGCRLQAPPQPDGLQQQPNPVLHQRRLQNKETNTGKSRVAHNVHVRC